MLELAAFDAVMFFGHLHPVLVHLPIGVVIALVVVELAGRFHYFRGSVNSRGILLILAVLSAAASIACGLLLARSGGYDDFLINWHKRGTIIFGILCALALIANFLKWGRVYGVLLTLAILVLIPAAHFGASMTHGEDYLTEYAPDWVQKLAGYKPADGENKTETAETTTSPKDPEQANVFKDIVQPILNKDCMSCHSSEKMKGELVLEDLQSMKEGGKHGPAIVPGDSAKSILIQRISLPIDDKNHMAPKGKPQLSDEQIALLQWWVEAGAPADKTVAQLNPPTNVMDTIDASLGVHPEKVAEPAPLKQIAPKVAELSQSLHVMIMPIAADQPQLRVNASVARSFGDAELAKLAEIGANIIELDLAGTKVTDSGLSSLAKMPNLQRLRLDRTTIGDTGLAQLTKLRKLEYLNLAETSVSDAGVKSLRGMTSLKKIFLWKTSVDPAAANQLADSMIDKAKVRRIKQQIESLQAQLDATPVAVYTGVATSRPATTQASTKPATRSATSTSAPSK